MLKFVFPQHHHKYHHCLQRSGTVDPDQHKNRPRGLNYLVLDESEAL